MRFSTHHRHLFKSLTWRVLATIDTILLSWFITGDLTTGTKIGIVEVFTKIALYYFHERLWFKAPLPNSKKRHLVKTFTWRFVGSADTFLLSWIITGNVVFGVQISFIEAFSKMLLFYIHERIWHHYKLGIKKNS